MTRLALSVLVSLDIVIKAIHAPVQKKLEAHLLEHC